MNRDTVSPSPAFRELFRAYLPRNRQSSESHDADHNPRGLGGRWNYGEDGAVFSGFYGEDALPITLIDDATGQPVDILAVGHINSSDHYSDPSNHPLTLRYLTSGGEVWERVMHPEVTDRFKVLDETQIYDLIEKFEA